MGIQEEMQQMGEQGLRAWYEVFKREALDMAQIDLTKKEDLGRVMGFYPDKDEMNAVMGLTGKAIHLYAPKEEQFAQLERQEAVPPQWYYDNMQPDESIEKIKSLYELSRQGGLMLFDPYYGFPRCAVTDREERLQVTVPIDKIQWEDLMGVKPQKPVDETNREAMEQYNRVSVRYEEAKKQRYTIDGAVGEINGQRICNDDLCINWIKRVVFLGNAHQRLHGNYTKRVCDPIPADAVKPMLEEMYRVLNDADPFILRGGSQEYQNMKNALREAKDLIQLDGSTDYVAYREAMNRLSKATNSYIAMKGNHPTGIHGQRRLEAALSVKKRLQDFFPVPLNTQYENIRNNFSHLDQLLTPYGTGGIAVSVLSPDAESLITLGCYISQKGCPDEYMDHRRFIEELCLDDYQPDGAVAKYTEQAMHKYYDKHREYVSGEFYSAAADAVEQQFRSKTSLGAETVVWGQFAQKLMDTYHEFERLQGLTVDKEQLRRFGAILDLSRLGESRLQMEEQMKNGNFVPDIHQAAELVAQTYVDCMVREKGMDAVLQLTMNMRKLGQTWKDIFVELDVTRTLAREIVEGRQDNLLENPIALVRTVNTQLKHKEERVKEQSPENVQENVSVHQKAIQPRKKP